MNIKGYKILISIYMPTDNDGNTNLEAYQDTLNHVSQAIHTSNINNNIIIGGDFNSDFNRTQSGHTNAINNLHDKNLYFHVWIYTIQLWTFSFKCKFKVNGAKFIYCGSLSHFTESDNRNNET